VACSKKDCRYLTSLPNEQNGSGGHDAPLLYVSVPFYGRLLPKRHVLAMSMM
jgi:hypothetical protein